MAAVGDARKRAAENRATTSRPYCLRCEVPIYRDDEGVWRREATGSQVCPRNPAVDGHEPLPPADASERAAGELVADVDTLAAAIRRVDGNHDLGAGALAEALVAAGFGNVAAARREIAGAERRGAYRALRDLYASFTDEDSDIEIALMGGDLVRVRILDAIDNLGAAS